MSKLGSAVNKAEETLFDLEKKLDLRQPYKPRDVEFDCYCFNSTTRALIGKDARSVIDLINSDQLESFQKRALVSVCYHSEFDNQADRDKVVEFLFSQIDETKVEDTLEFQEKNNLLHVAFEKLGKISTKESWLRISDYLLSDDLDIVTYSAQVFRNIIMSINPTERYLIPNQNEIYKRIEDLFYSFLKEPKNIAQLITLGFVQQTFFIQNPKCCAEMFCNFINQVKDPFVIDSLQFSCSLFFERCKSHFEDAHYSFDFYEPSFKKINAALNSKIETVYGA